MQVHGRPGLETLTHPSARQVRGGEALDRVIGSPLRQGNEPALLRDGRETYGAWLTEIERARHWVHLENYIFLDDEVGRLFSATLRAVAARGVAVRVLVDWFGSAEVGRSFWEEMRSDGVDVRLVNPPRVTRPLKALQRDHRKFVGVDGRYASVGGLCIGEQWLERSVETGLPYRDTAIAVRGPVVADLEDAFASVWKLTGTPLPAAERPRAREIPEAGTTAVRAVVQKPGEMRLLWFMQLIAAGVRRRLWIADAYFLSVPALHRALITAARDGVDVRLLTPSASDLWLVSPLTRIGYRPLLEAGVRVWEYRGLMMHSKTMVADGWWSRVGSTNLNVTGLLTNWELDVLVEDAAFARKVEDMFEADLADSAEVRLAGSGPRRHVEPAKSARWTGPERRALKRKTRETGARTAAAVVQAGEAALTGLQLTRQERRVMGGAAVAALGLAGLAARFPRLAAWPIAGFLCLGGIGGMLRAARHSGASATDHSSGEGPSLYEPLQI
jgi:cardiolipin synthase A/B